MARFLGSRASVRIAMLHSLWRRSITETYYRALFGAIGRGCVLYRNELLINSEYMTLGDGVMIRYGSRMEVVLHGQEWTPRLTIGDNVNIEQCVHIICHDDVVIERNVSVAPFCVILDTSFSIETGVRDGRKIGSVVSPKRSSVSIGENTLIGAGVTILANVRIGRNCMIGAGSVVTSDIPDCCIAAGVPARVIRQVKSVSGPSE
jgi:acetyltransferase-like isoleucine patch superfamily enzyme